jgi:hypothetical protein
VDDNDDGRFWREGFEGLREGNESLEGDESETLSIFQFQEAADVPLFLGVSCIPKQTQKITNHLAKTYQQTQQHIIYKQIANDDLPSLNFFLLKIKRTQWCYSASTEQYFCLSAKHTTICLQKQQ